MNVVLLQGELPVSTDDCGKNASYKEEYYQLIEISVHGHPTITNCHYSGHKTMSRRCPL